MIDRSGVGPVLPVSHDLGRDKNLVYPVTIIKISGSARLKVKEKTSKKTSMKPCGITPNL
jgi:hypothetical protein